MLAAAWTRRVAPRSFSPPNSEAAACAATLDSGGSCKGRRNSRAESSQTTIPTSTATLPRTTGRTGRRVWPVMASATIDIRTSLSSTR